MKKSFNNPWIHRIKQYKTQSKKKETIEDKEIVI